MKITDIMERYQISTRSLATLLDVTPATISYWQKTHNGEIPQKFLKNAENVFKTIDKISELSNSSFPEICPLILEFKKSPFWRDWPHLSYILLQSLPLKDGGSNQSLVDSLKQYLESREKQLLKEPFKLPQKLKELTLDIDLVLQSSDTTLVGAFLYNTKITLNDIFKELSIVEDIHNEYPKSVFYFFATEIENSIHLATEDSKYIRLIKYIDGSPLSFEDAKPK